MAGKDYQGLAGVVVPDSDGVIHASWEQEVSWLVNFETPDTLAVAWEHIKLGLSIEVLSVLGDVTLLVSYEELALEVVYSLDSNAGVKHIRGCLFKVSDLGILKVISIQFV